jgi:hypothetical protein
MNVKKIMEQVAWFFSRWWAHTRALIKVPQFWITLAVMLGLSLVFAYFATEPTREFFVRSFQYVRVGEYIKGWKELEKTFGVAPVKEPPRAVQGATAVISPKPGENSPPPGPLSPTPSGPDLFDKIPWGFLFAGVLSVLAVRIVIYAIEMSYSIEIKFRWRTEDQEDTEPPGFKDGIDPGRRKRIRVVALLDILKKIKMSFSSAHPSASRPRGTPENIPYGANDIITGAVHRPVPSFAVGSQGANRENAWVVHLFWFLMGLYILFLLVCLVLGAFFLF